MSWISSRLDGTRFPPRRSSGSSLHGTHVPGELPPHATIRVKAIMGTVVLYVPRGMRVTVRSRVYLGDVDAIGEHVNGVVAFGHEEHVPAGGPAPVEIVVEVLSVMANVRVVLTDGQPVVSLSEVMRETIRAAATGLFCLGRHGRFSRGGRMVWRCGGALGVCPDGTYGL